MLVGKDAHRSVLHPMAQVGHRLTEPCLYHAEQCGMRKTDRHFQTTMLPTDLPCRAWHMQDIDNTCHEMGTEDFIQPHKQHAVGATTICKYVVN